MPADLPLLEHLTLPGDGVSLHAVACGDPADPLVLLLHGFPEYWYGWRNQLRPLADAGYRVVALDQRGYAASDKPARFQDYDIDRLAADAESVIAALGAGRAAVVGHDWGGGVAWWLALTRPHRVSRLAVLNCPHPTAMRNALFGGDFAQLMRSWYMFAIQIPRLPEWAVSRNDFEPLERSMRTSARPGSFTGADFVEYRKAWSAPEAMTAMLNWYRAAIRQPRSGFDPRVRVPTLVVWGERDKFLRAKLARDSVKFCDDGRLVALPTATHWVQHDAPDRVNRLLIDFLAGDSDGSLRNSTLVVAGSSNPGT